MIARVALAIIILAFGYTFAEGIIWLFDHFPDFAFAALISLACVSLAIAAYGIADLILSEQ